MTRYTIGGAAFTVEEALPGLSTGGFTDVEIAASFTDDDPGCSSLTTRQVTGPGGLTGWVDPAELICWLPDVHRNPDDRAWHLRQMAPVFSSVLKRLVLHASAVEVASGVVGFIGESGAGKSTLARFLDAKGYRLIADDLTPIRFTPLPHAPVGSRLRPIAALFFLRRTSTDATMIEALSAIDALRLLVDNGFGEHGDAEAWAFQFDAYHQLVESIPHARLTIPDTVSALDGVRQTLERSLIFDR